MAGLVYIFNTAPVPITVSVSNGAQFSVPAANAATWAPGVPATNPGFTGGRPEQGKFGYGPNGVTVAPAGGFNPGSATIGISQNINPASALQLYLFLPRAGEFGWMLCDNGHVVAGNPGL